MSTASPAAESGPQNPSENRQHPPVQKKSRTHWLYIAVIVAVLAGIVVGLVAPGVGQDLKVLGTIFVSLIKMMIAPIILCTIVLGIGSVRKASTVGATGLIALVYFLVMSTFALAIGLVVGNLIEPGDAIHIDPAGSSAGSKLAQDAEGGGGFVGFLQHIVPETFFSSLTAGNVLQVLFIALLIGFAVQSLGKKGEPVIAFFEAMQRVVFKILMWILWLAPIGAFGAMAGVVGGTGLKAVGALLVLMLAFYLTCIVFIVVVLGTVLRFVAGVSVFKLLRYLGREFLLIFATSSSESALPLLMEKMEFAGVDRSTVGIVVPTGYSFNLDGTAIYLTMSALFISEAMDMPMSIPQQIGLLVFMIIASKGAAGVSGAGLATLAAGLQAHRAELLGGVDVIVGIDRFMSEARALTNFAGNAIATLVVGSWTHTVDHERVQKVMDREIRFVPAASEDDEYDDAGRSVAP